MTRKRYQQRATSASGAGAEASSGRFAKGLGWFSIVFGTAEVIAPRAFARWLGMPGCASLIALYGVREIVVGIGILSSKDKAPWLWGRVAGDVMDGATVLNVLRSGDRTSDNAVIALAGVAGFTVADVYCAKQLSCARSSSAYDYSDRSGFSRPASEMRGVASDFQVPRDMRDRIG
jgi:hypothetical protein